MGYIEIMQISSSFSIDKKIPKFIFLVLGLVSCFVVMKTISLKGIFLNLKYSPKISRHISVEHFLRNGILHIWNAAIATKTLS
jgi:hypothetical protein